MKVAIIGGGAAGCFCSIILKRLCPEAEITVFEAGKKLLSKVAVTGGGRCNLTNSFTEIGSLGEAYPRGERLMKRLLMEFGHKETMAWFEGEGVELVLEDGQFVFPASQDAMQIVRTLTRLMEELKVSIRTGHNVTAISPGKQGYIISFQGNNLPEARADTVVVTTGGKPSRRGLDFLEGLNLQIIAPVPSLFTFSIADSSLRALMGTVIEETSVSLAGTPFHARGPLLITDWGMSGPAILKLSSYGARFLADKGYKAMLSVNWLDTPESEAREILGSIAADSPQKLISSARPRQVPSRLWAHLCSRAGLRADQRWAETGTKGMNRLVSALTADLYEIAGKSRFREEFVTCGGVALSSVSMSTLEAKEHSGMYFAGEVLDVDAVTGGFNLQAAWSMGHRVACSIARAYREKQLTDN